MTLKFLIVCASLAIVSCGRVDQEQLARQMEQQEELIQQQNERIRDHQRVENEQRQEQIRDLEDQQRRQEQLIREQEQQRREIVQPVYIAAHHPQFLPAAFQFITIPTIQRNFERHDGSNYNFGYSLNDATTGDVKSQQEVRRGDQVQGHYSMMDSDGYQRTVDYRADDKNGFDAEVRREVTSAAVVAHPQLVRIDGNNGYATHFYHYQQPTTFLTPQPTIYSSTSVSRNDDGQRSQYTSRSTSNF